MNIHNQDCLPMPGHARRVIALGVTMACAVPALAQTPEQSAGIDSEVSEIVVTGSRIDTVGFDAPTPTTVIGESELHLAGRTDIAATLADVPQFRATTSGLTNNTLTSSGVATADLRGLGAARTLVLINGRRYVSAGDLQTVPYSLVERIEVVTGGASAAYGSGAVAGAVNIILNDDLQGVELGVQRGISSRDDAEKFLIEAAFGTSFLDDRGHFMIGADYLDDKGIMPGTRRPRVGAAGFFPGEDGLLYPTTNLTEAIRNADGVINTGALAGQTFNPDGSLRPFEYGIQRPGTAMMIGGEGYHIDQVRSISAPIDRRNVFARAAYDVSDSLQVWVEGGYNRVADERPFFAELTVSQLTFPSDNPFLDPSVSDALAAAGETTFTMGRALTDDGFLQHYDYGRDTSRSRSASTAVSPTAGGATTPSTVAAN